MDWAVYYGSYYSDDKWGLLPKGAQFEISLSLLYSVNSFCVPAMHSVLPKPICRVKLVLLVRVQCRVLLSCVDDVSPEVRENSILYKHGWFVSQNRQSCLVMPWACNSLLPEEDMDSIWIQMLATSITISCQLTSLPRWGGCYFSCSLLSLLSLLSLTFHNKSLFYFPLPLPINLLQSYQSHNKWQFSCLDEP